MFKIVVVLLGVIGVWALFNLGESEERAAAVQYSGERNEAQDKILIGLTAMGDTAVNEFVRDWRSAVTQPTPELLSELRVIEQNIKNDNAIAVKYTLAWKNKNSLCGQVKSTFGSDHGCGPGL